MTELEYEINAIICFIIVHYWAFNLICTKWMTYFPTKFSSTELLPALCPPTTAICGRSRFAFCPMAENASCIRLTRGIRSSIPRFPMATDRHLLELSPDKQRSRFQDVLFRHWFILKLLPVSLSLSVCFYVRLSLSAVLLRWWAAFLRARAHGHALQLRVLSLVGALVKVTVISCHSNPVVGRIVLKKKKISGTKGLALNVNTPVHNGRTQK